MQNLKHTVCEYNSWGRKQTNKQDKKKNILFALFVDGHDTNYVIRIAKGSKELRGHPNLTSFPASFIEKNLGTRLAQAQTGCLPLPFPSRFIDYHHSGQYQVCSQFKRNFTPK